MIHDQLAIFDGQPVLVHSYFTEEYNRRLSNCIGEIAVS